MSECPRVERYANELSDYRCRETGQPCEEMDVYRLCRVWLTLELRKQTARVEALVRVLRGAQTTLEAVLAHESVECEFNQAKRQRMIEANFERYGDHTPGAKRYDRPTHGDIVVWVEERLGQIAAASHAAKEAP